MKSSVVAVALLVLTVPVHASEFREIDYKWEKAIDRYEELYNKCFYPTPDTQEGKNYVPQAPVCKTLDRLSRKLEADGYCFIGQAVVGRFSRDKKHCYTIATIASAIADNVKGSWAEWDCGKGVKVTSNRNALGVSVYYGPDRNSPDADDETKWQLRGARHFDLKWDLRVENKGTEIWLNDRVCKRTN